MTQYLKLFMPLYACLKMPGVVAGDIPSSLFQPWIKPLFSQSCNLAPQAINAGNVNLGT